MGNSWKSAQQMATHTKPKQKSMHVCAAAEVLERGLLGSREKGAWGVQGEGGVWAGSKFGCESALGGQVWAERGTVEEHAGCTGSPSTCPFFFACAAVCVSTLDRR